MLYIALPFSSQLLIQFIVNIYLISWMNCGAGWSQFTSRQPLLFFQNDHYEQYLAIYFEFVIA